jgi:hypothetical protein
VEGVNDEAVAERFGHNLTADDASPFKDKNLPAFLRKIPRGDQSIMPGADDDVIVLILCHLTLQMLCEVTFVF